MMITMNSDNNDLKITAMMMLMAMMMIIAMMIMAKMVMTILIIVSPTIISYKEVHIHLSTDIH